VCIFSLICEICWIAFCCIELMLCILVGRFIILIVYERVLCYYFSLFQQPVFVGVWFCYLYVSVYVSFMRSLFQVCLFLLVTVGLVFILLLFAVSLYGIICSPIQGRARCQETPLDGKPVIGSVEVLSQSAQNHVARWEIAVICSSDGDDDDDDDKTVVAALFCVNCSGVG